MIQGFPKPKDRRIVLVSKDDKTRMIPIDVAISISPNYESTTVDTPLENGTTITDHVVTHPITLDLSCFIGSMSPSIESSLRGAASSFLISQTTGKINPLAGPASAIALATASNFLDQTSERVRTAYTTLEKLWSERTLVQVIDGFLGQSNPFNTMVITSFLPRFTVDSGDGLIFDLSLKKINLIEFENVEIDIKRTNGNKKVAQKQSGEKNAGHQQLTEATQEAQKQAKSLLKSLSEYVGNLF